MATYTNIADAEAALLLNLDYEEVGSVTKAKAVVSAARAWMILRPESAAAQAESMTIGKQFVSDILESARRYIAANNSSATNSSNTGTRFLSVNEGFR